MPEQHHDSVHSPEWQNVRRSTEHGQGMVEYAFILVLIALVLILIVTVLGHRTENLYSNVSNALPH